MENYYASVSSKHSKDAESGKSDGGSWKSELGNSWKGGYGYSDSTGSSGNKARGEFSDQIELGSSCKSSSSVTRLVGGGGSASGWSAGSADAKAERAPLILSGGGASYSEPADELSDNL